MLFSAVFGFAAAVSAATVPSASKKVLARGEDGEISCEHPTAFTGPKQERENFVEGQEYLRGRDMCGAKAGEPCSRVSCSNDAGMFLCAGDQDVEVECGVIADYMDHIFDECQESGLYAVDAAYGSQKNTDGWWVEVGWQSC